MSQSDMSHWVLEPDTFEPEDETMTEAEMDAVCRNLLASTEAYQRGEIPMRETRLLDDGRSLIYWRFVDGPAMDRYRLVVEPNAEHHGCIAYAPDLPGCVVAAPTFDEAWVLVRREVDVWMEEAMREGRPIPSPSAQEKQEVRTAAFAELSEVA